jgi:hypothetical protein
MFMHLLTLQFLWDLLKPILTDTAKDRLKPKVSAEIAKNRSFDLYNALELVEECSREFVQDLENCADSAAAVRLSDEKEVQEKWLSDLSHLQTIADKTSQALAKMIRALKDVNPQMSVHNPLLGKTVTMFDGARSGAIAYTECLLTKEAAKLYPGQVQTIQRIAAEAKINHQLIENGIANLRDFLAANFSFKESF